MASRTQDAAAKSKAVQAVTVADGAAYDGSDLDGETIDRIPDGSAQRYDSIKFVLETGNGTASDAVQAKLYESSDDTNWDEVTDVTFPELNDAAEFETLDVDAASLKRYLRIELLTADQTVDSSIDFAAYALLCGSKETPASDA